jgi:hypothetical protein
LSKAGLKWSKLVCSIPKAWGFGFLADAIGALLLIGPLFLWPELLQFCDPYNPLRDPLSFLASIVVIGAVGTLIGKFNYHLLQRQGIEKSICRRVGIAMGILTAPWMFLIPSTIGFQLLGIY